MNTETMVFLGIFWFAGLFIGWFLNWWPLTLSFVVGLLIHTWKPLYRKLQEL